jgi:hypothetical protein
VKRTSAQGDRDPPVLRRCVLFFLAILTISITSPLAAKEQRSHWATAEFQREHPCPATGSTHGACPGWIKDHVLALACGGPDAPSNMQGQTVAEAKAKDRWEFQCARPSRDGSRPDEPGVLSSGRATFWDRVAAERLLEEARRRESRR